MLDATEQRIRGDVVVVGVQAVEIVAVILVGRRIETQHAVDERGRHAPVRAVLLLQILVAGDEARRGAQTKADARRKAQRLFLGDVAAGDATVQHQQVQTRGRSRAQRLVEICSRAQTRVCIVLIETVARADAVGVFQLGGLGDQIDVAASTAAAVVGRRAFRYFHLFDVEDVAAVAARIATTIDKDVAAAVEAAQAEVVGVGRKAVLAGAEADARRIAEHVGQILCALLAIDGLGNDRQCLRCIQQRRRELRRTGGLRVQRAAGHGNRRQRLRSVGRSFRGRGAAFRCRRLRQRCHRAQAEGAAAEDGGGDRIQTEYWGQRLAAVHRFSPGVWLESWRA